MIDETRKQIAKEIGDAFLSEVGVKGISIKQACRDMHADYPSICRILGKKAPITMLYAVKMLDWCGAKIKIVAEGDRKK